MDQYKDSMKLHINNEIKKVGAMPSVFECLQDRQTLLIDQKISETVNTYKNSVIKESEINMTKELNGVRFQIINKEIDCDPPVPLPIVQDVISITEESQTNSEYSGANSKKALTQFLTDALKFQGALSAQKLAKYQNMYIIDLQNSINNEGQTTVIYESVDGEEIKYIRDHNQSQFKLELIAGKEVL
ncbi:UNKNOWN [Stylonychia lemnae]|uniref:Uncharacterized protein n=1 Tax=Stylonychia lemnae TaxID=5949 RepID=A0A078AWC5_STYLE|nr:UNKNOWN [Stylonychia lemnae]|eukprot:CDW86444.1 UNKNOWN [Stylonychia lemnae]